MKKDTKKIWGLLSQDGYFRSLDNLNVDTLEYTIRSTRELEQLLKEKEKEEKYEQCAIIRDELLRRAR